MESKELGGVKTTDRKKKNCVLVGIVLAYPVRWEAGRYSARARVQARSDLVCICCSLITMVTTKVSGYPLPCFAV